MCPQEQDAGKGRREGLFLLCVRTEVAAVPGACPRQRPGKQADCTMPWLLRQRSIPSCLPITALPLSCSPHAFLSLLSHLFSSCLPSFL